MPYAPFYPMSREALAAATVSTAGVTADEPRPRPHQVILRIKRKRGDMAVESLVVAAPEEFGPDRKRRLAADSVADHFADLTLSKKCCEERDQQQEPVQMAPHLFSKRVQTSDNNIRLVEKGSSRPATPPAQVEMAVTLGVGGGGGKPGTLSRCGTEETGAPVAAVVDYLEVRRIRAKAKAAHAMFSDVGDQSERLRSSSREKSSASANFQVIDIQRIGKSETAEIDVHGVYGGARLAAGETSTRSQAGAPVLNPLERQVDEAIFSAFRTGDMSTLRDILSTSPAFVNYRRRVGDSTTPLMAAAFHGDMDAVRYFLSLGAKASLVDNWGKTAVLLAGMRGHRDCFAKLQRVADEESAREKGPRGVHDFVYDLYYFSPAESRATPLVGGSGSGDTARVEKAGDETQASTQAPVVLLSGIGPLDENATVKTGLELTFENNSDWSEPGDDAGEDPDSNSEGFFANDYPEEEGGEDESGPPYFDHGSSSSSENESSGDDAFSSDEETYDRKVVHSVEFDRTRTFRSPFSSSPENDGGQLQQVSTSKADTIDDPVPADVGGGR